jgi:hypothetical protein
VVVRMLSTKVCFIHGGEEVREAAKLSNRTSVNMKQSPDQI